MVFLENLSFFGYEFAFLWPTRSLILYHLCCPIKWNRAIANWSMDILFLFFASLCFSLFNSLYFIKYSRVFPRSVHILCLWLALKSVSSPKFKFFIFNSRSKTWNFFVHGWHYGLGFVNWANFPKQPQKVILRVCYCLLIIFLLHL